MIVRRKVVSIKSLCKAFVSVAGQFELTDPTPPTDSQKLRQLGPGASRPAFDTTSLIVALFTRVVSGKGMKDRGLG